MMHTIIHFLLQNGIGQNITAGALTLVLGYLWSLTKFWPLNALHEKIDALHEKHDALHEKHDELHKQLAELHASHEQLASSVPAGVSGSGPSKPAL